MKRAFIVFTVFAIIGAVASGCSHLGGGSYSKSYESTAGVQGYLGRDMAEENAMSPLNPENGKPYDLTFFENYGVNPFIATEDERFSTFGMDVDTASYTIARRFIMDGNVPDKASVRTEEFINYFKQDYPDEGGVFTVSVEGAESPFGKPNYHMLKIGVKAKNIRPDERRPANMVFVVDVSGSMDREDRLEQVKRSLRELARNLKEGDRVGLVVYGSQGRVISDLTSNVKSILRAVNKLRPDGSTNAEEGLVLAYRMMRENYEAGKINRIILCSDGVANTGETQAEEILKRVEAGAKSGITLTTLGFGMGNYNDVFMEKLANKGDGSYYYIDSPEESARVFDNGAVSLLQLVAKDAKIQVEFSPETVERYRLLGYENRRLEKEDFRDDTVDAGEVCSGQTVTALYELRIKDGALGNPVAEAAVVRVRYTDPDSGKAREHGQLVHVATVAKKIGEASPRLRFTAAVAEFAELLKESYWAKDGSMRGAYTLAAAAVKEMPGTRQDENEFLSLVRTAMKLTGESAPEAEHRTRNDAFEPHPELEAI